MRLTWCDWTKSDVVRSFVAPSSEKENVLDSLKSSLSVLPGLVSDPICHRDYPGPLRTEDHPFGRGLKVDLNHWVKIVCLVSSTVKTLIQCFSVTENGTRERERETSQTPFGRRYDTRRITSLGVSVLDSTGVDYWSFLDSGDRLLDFPRLRTVEMFSIQTHRGTS